MGVKVPEGYEHDVEQQKWFGTAQAYEDEFARYKPVIGGDYIDGTNALLRRMDEVCRSDYDQEGYDGIPEHDVLQIALWTVNSKISLDLIGIRPCFVGHKLFQIVMYQLISSARSTGKTLVVGSCFPRTLNIMRAFFADVMEVEGGDCKFDNPDKMWTITVDSMRIADYVDITSNGVVQLREAMFPSADQLNDPQYVDRHYLLSTARSPFPIRSMLPRSFCA